MGGNSRMGAVVNAETVAAVPVRPGSTATTIHANDKKTENTSGKAILGVQAQEHIIEDCTTLEPEDIRAHDIDTVETDVALRGAATAPLVCVSLLLHLVALY